MKNEVEFIKEQIIKYNLTAHSRKRQYVYKRFYCMYRLHKCQMTLKDTAHLFGLKHCAALYGIRMHKRWIKYKDLVYAEEIAPIIAASKGCDYEGKYRVKAKETQNDISVLLKIPYEYDLVSYFKDYMTINEIVSALQKLK